MLAVFDLNTTTEFIHPQDTSEPKTIFTTGLIDAKAQAWVDKTFVQLSWTRTGKINPETKFHEVEPSVNVDQQSKQIELVKLGLKGIKNFPATLVFVDEQYPFGTRKVLDDASLNAVKPYIPALAKFIENNSNVTIGDEKK